MTRLVAPCVLGLSIALGAACPEKPVEATPAAPDGSVAEAQANGEPDAGHGPTAHVAVIIGTVEVRRAEAANWSPVREGDELGTEDAVRTGDEARLEIDYENIKIRVHERSELKLKTISNAGVRGQLRGQADTEVPSGRGVVELEAEGSDAVARTEGGAFSMTADGQGVVAVGTSSGWADLSAEGESIRIPTGMISVVPGKGKPKKPSQALRNVLLSVTWPEHDETNQKTYPVSGQVEPGARVAIGGQDVRVDERGRFKAQVPLRQGKQRVGVVATDVLGRKKRSDRQVLYDPTAPDFRLTRKPWSK
ncbi:MAG TPA: hypothetical protein VFA20_19660 [Myxococcaceae bacterium]|nr:hypothetical protein [Myxococcaceae bacterium]